MSAQLQERKQQVLRSTITETLVDSARALEALESPSEDERMVKAWVFDELERRAGYLTLEEEPQFARVFDSTGSYLQALLTLRPALGEYL